MKPYKRLSPKQKALFATGTAGAPIIGGTIGMGFGPVGTVVGFSGGVVASTLGLKYIKKKKFGKY